MELRLTVVLAALLLAARSGGAPAERGTWHQPCGRSVKAHADTGRHSERHELGRLLRTVKTQIGVATKHIKKEERNIHTTYHQVGLLKEERYLYDWLPQKQLNWYNKIKCLDKPVKVQRVLQVFHSSLQNFSVTFEELKKFNRLRIHPIRIARLRERLIEGLAEHLTQVLCEVESALYSLNLTIPDRVQEDFFSKRENWNPNPDATGSLVQDWGVITLYKKFLEQWQEIIDGVNKKPRCKRPENANKRKKKPKH